MSSVTSTSPHEESLLHDVAEGIEGIAIIAAAFFTPFMRGQRGHWGLDEAAATREYPGDELIMEPRWGWTHGVEIDAPPEKVWPWVAQMGGDHAGFYSYQWLLDGTTHSAHDADRVHPEWSLRTGAQLFLHPSIPPMPVVAVAARRYIVACAHSEAPEVETSWLLFLEPLEGGGRTRVVSRFRCACSDDVVTRLQYGPTLIEPIGYAMDRRMLLGLKAHVETALAPAQTAHL